MRELLEAGVHFGHQTRRWNPKMRRYIFGERGGIYLIDLTKTLELLEEAHEFARNIAERNGTVLFVGTKKQAQNAVAENATRVGMPYVSNRWLGGLLTNWRTISERIAYLHDLRRLKADGQLDLLPSKERLGMEADLEKLEANLGGVADMKRQPDAVFVIDLKKELLAVRETHRLGVPGDRARRHERRSGRGRVRDSRKRRRDSLLRPRGARRRGRHRGWAHRRSRRTEMAAPAAAAPAAEAEDIPRGARGSSEPELEPAAVAAEGGETE